MLCRHTCCCWPRWNLQQERRKGREGEETILNRVKQVKPSVRSINHCINHWWTLHFILSYLSSPSLHQPTFSPTKARGGSLDPSHQLSWFTDSLNEGRWTWMELDARNVGFLLWELWNLKSIGFKIETRKRDMYDFGRAHNFWIDIPVPHREMFSDSSPSSMSKTAFCWHALVHWWINPGTFFNNPQFYTFLTWLDWLDLWERAVTCQKKSWTLALVPGMEVRISETFGLGTLFFDHAFPQLFKSVFFDWKKSLVQGEDLSDDDIQAEFWWKSALSGVSTQSLEETLLFGGRNANSSESSWALHLDPSRIDEEIHQQATP